MQNRKMQQNIVSIAIETVIGHHMMSIVKSGSCVVLTLTSRQQ